jgi:hypothetical protein
VQPPSTTATGSATGHAIGAKPMYQNNKYAGLSAYKKKKMIEAEMMDPALTNVPQLLDPSGASAAELSRYGRLQCLLNVRKN